MTGGTGPGGDPGARTDPQAVFLSYASEDAEAAGRICASLRAAGIEVWFDRSELRGGDAWDAAIRRQIKSCALFIPVISQNSHLRAEGYFRLEWKLAVDRSHLMATDKAFLVPVVIDDTTLADERVPDRFRERQWIRLPGGAAPPDFVAHVQRLLAPAAAPRSAPESLAGATAHAPPARRRPRAVIALAALAAVAALGAVAWFAGRPSSHRAPIAPYSAEDRRMTFAVLPFQAPPDDARAAHVAKATADVVATGFESLTVYAQTTSRRSVEEAAAHLTAPRDIARALGVHFLIRGTLARSARGYTVNLVTLDGTSERSLGTATLEVASDALVPRWRDDVDDAAFHLMLTGLEAEVKAAADVPASALDVRDLSFRAFSQWRAHRGKEARQGYEGATELLKQALTKAPDDPFATYLTAEINLCDCVMAWSRNVEEQKALGAAALEKYLRIDPNDVEMLTDKAQLFQLRGRFDESAALTDVVLKRDPENANALALRAVELLRSGRAREALPIADGLFARYPDHWPSVAVLAADVHYASADYAGAAQLARNAAARMSEDELRSPVDGTVRLTLAASEARLGHAERATAALADFRASVPHVDTLGLIRKWIYPTANLFGYEPLLEGLKLAGVRD